MIKWQSKNYKQKQWRRMDERIFVIFVIIEEEQRCFHSHSTSQTTSNYGIYTSIRVRKGLRYKFIAFIRSFKSTVKTSSVAVCTHILYFFCIYSKNNLKLEVIEFICY